MRPSSKAGLSTDRATGESMAVAALSFLAADRERLEKFLSVTGLGPGNLRAAAADPGFYGSILGYLAADERLLVMFAAEEGIPPEQIARALARLESPPLPGEP